MNTIRSTFLVGMISTLLCLGCEKPLTLAEVDAEIAKEADGSGGGGGHTGAHPGTITKYDAPCDKTGTAAVQLPGMSKDDIVTRVKVVVHGGDSLSSAYPGISDFVGLVYPAEGLALTGCGNIPSGSATFYVSSAQ